MYPQNQNPHIIPQFTQMAGSLPPNPAAGAMVASTSRQPAHIASTVRPAGNYQDIE